MFFIVNKTKTTLVLSDVGVTLGPRQAIDLDKVVSRSKSESSKHLKQARKGGQIEVRMKDGEKPTSPIKTSSEAPSLDSFKQDIIDEMKGSIKELSKELVVPQSDSNGINSKDLDALARRIIANMPKTSETVIIQESKARTDEEVEVDEDKLSEISTRAVNEMVRDTEVKSINYKEEEQENTILDDAEELEDLLG
jgi:hypothetical protein